MNKRSRKTKRKSRNKSKRRYHKKTTFEIYRQLILHYNKH